MNRPTHLIATLLVLAGCGGDTAGTAPQEPPATPTNRIDVPAAVRRNLGIEFVTVQRRRVAATIRLPGHFELLPAARREHRAMLPGQVEVQVALLQRVAAGELLGTLDSAAWRTLQRELGDLQTQSSLDAARIEALEPLLAAHQTHEQSLASAIEVLAARIASLEATRQEVGGQAGPLADANVALAQLRASAAEAAEQHTETQTRLVELRAAVIAGDERFELALSGAAAVTGIAVDELRTNWRSVGRIELRAISAGVVEQIEVSAGGFVQAGALLLTVADPTQARFRAHAPQSDLARLRPGSATRIAAPDPGMAAVEGPLQLGIDIDRETRMVELFVTASPAPAWARPGLAAFLEVETETSGEPALAIPRRAVQRDGLKRVVFRRDAKQPDQVIRVEVDLGVDDGEWVVVKSELTDGDEVVVAGAYELMLASSDSTPKGGHFHADGTWHADGDK